MPLTLTIRPYTPADLPEMVKLFQETVRRVCVKDYTPVQIEAWVGKVDLASWEKTLAEHTTLLAFDGEALPGSAISERTGTSTGCMSGGICRGRGLGPPSVTGWRRRGIFRGSSPRRPLPPGRFSPTVGIR